jgi:hypothetical protein
MIEVETFPQINEKKQVLFNMKLDMYQTQTPKRFGFDPCLYEIYLFR